MYYRYINPCRAVFAQNVGKSINFINYSETGGKSMKKYENLEIEVSALNVSDVITTSPIKITDTGVDTPWVGLTPDGPTY